MKIYFPMSANVLVKGHIVMLKKLYAKGDVVIGLLTSKALKNYKKEVVPYVERKYILENFFNNIVVPQDSLDPSKNIKKYSCDAIASGDGWEKSEIAAIKKLGIKKIDVKSGCKRHSSDIWKK